MKKVTFLERVKAVLKGGDDAKLARFQSKLEKYFEKQIKARKEQIETLQDKIVDAAETLSDTIESVNLESIATTESTEAYCKTYVQKVQSALVNKNNIKDEIISLKEEINELETLKNTIFEEVTK